MIYIIILVGIYFLATSEKKSVQILATVGIVVGALAIVLEKGFA